MRSRLGPIVVCLLAGVLPGSLPAGKDEAIKPTNLGKVNTAADEDDPFQGPDALSLFYATNANGTWDIYAAHRATPAKAWPAGTPFLDSKTADERSPFMHRATQFFYFATNMILDPKLADLKNFDIYRKLGMTAPIPVIGISERPDELNPWITPAGKEFYFSRKTDDGWMLFVADGPMPGPIGKAKAVGFPADFHHATLSASATLMYLQGPLDEGRTGLFRSKRAKVGEPWSKPEPIPHLSHADAKRGDSSPSLSFDGARLYYASDRPGGNGGLDLWSVPVTQLK